jgi:hypothetical protein
VGDCHGYDVDEVILLGFDASTLVASARALTIMIVCFFETSVSTYESTQRQYPKICSCDGARLRFCTTAGGLLYYPRMKANVSEWASEID